MSDSAVQRGAKLRPQFRNIGIADITTRYRLPLAAKLSILHRVSGALLFLCLPLVILPIFAMSVGSPESYAELAQVAGHPFVKLILLVLIWGYLHHFCAGVRFLALDLHIGTDKVASAKSAGMSFGISLALTLVFGLKLFGVW